MNFHTQLVCLITEQDRKASKKKFYNPHALALMLKAGEDVTDALSFSKAFTPTRENHAMARKLKLPLDVDHGQWVSLTE